MQHDEQYYLYFKSFYNKYLYPHPTKEKPKKKKMKKNLIQQLKKPKQGPTDNTIQAMIF